MVGESAEEAGPSTSLGLGASAASTAAQKAGGKRRRLRGKKARLSKFDVTNMSAEGQEAQRLERERLERIERGQQESLEIFVKSQTMEEGKNGAVTDADYESGSESVASEDSMSNDGDEICVIREVTTATRGKRPHPSSGEVIELSSDEEDTAGHHHSSLSSLQRLPQGVLQGRRRRERKDEDLDKVDLTSEGQLLVNQGKPKEDPDVFVAQHLTSILQPHQIGGIRFLYDNIIESLKDYASSGGFGCILAHIMGLGKTLQVIAFIEILLRVTNAKKVLVICPVNTIQNWMREFDKWLPERDIDGETLRAFPVHLLGDTVKGLEARTQLVEKWDTDGGVLLVGYEMLRQLVRLGGSGRRGQVGAGSKLTLQQMESALLIPSVGELKEKEKKVQCTASLREALLNPGPDLVVCDEGHRIKNLNSEAARALKSIRTKRRIVLTGYPLQNNLIEYFCMIDFVRPQFLGTRKNFVTMFVTPIKKGQCKDSTPQDVKLAKQRIHVLTGMLKGFVQRRSQHILKKILPENREYVLMLRKSPIQRALYKAFVDYARRESDSRGTNFNPIKAYHACSKILNHPDLLYDELMRRERVNQAKQSGRSSVHPPPGAQCAESCISSYSSFCNNGAGGLAHGSLVDATSTSVSSSYFPFVSEPSSWKGGFQQPAPDWQGSSHSALPSLNDLYAPSSIWDGMPAQVNKFDDDPYAWHYDTTPKCETTSNGGVRDEAVKHDNGFADEGEDEEERMIPDNAVSLDWSGPCMEGYERGVQENGTKITVAMVLINEAVLRGEKVLLFSGSIRTLDLIEEFLARQPPILEEDQGDVKTGTACLQRWWRRNETYCRFDGSTSGSEREKLISRFNQEESLHLFLISTKAGSLGINLVAATRVLIFDASWNPSHDAQAVCRIYRYGQRKRTAVYRLIMFNSIEKAIFSRQISKHGLQQRVVDEQNIESSVTTYELENLIHYDVKMLIPLSPPSSPDSKVAIKEGLEDGDLGPMPQVDDELLTTAMPALERHLAQAPFLHESLLQESEAGLSEQEKFEAQQLYERELNGEYGHSSAGSSHTQAFSTVQQRAATNNGSVPPLYHKPPPPFAASGVYHALPQAGGQWSTMHTHTNPTTSVDRSGYAPRWTSSVAPQQTEHGNHGVGAASTSTGRVAMMGVDTLMSSVNGHLCMLRKGAKLRQVGDRYWRRIHKDGREGDILDAATARPAQSSTDAELIELD